MNNPIKISPHDPRKPPMPKRVCVCGPGEGMPCSKSIWRPPRRAKSQGYPNSWLVHFMVKIPSINGWFTMENPIYKWMMTGGTPMTKRKHPYRGAIFSAKDQAKWNSELRLSWCFHWCLEIPVLSFDPQSFGDIKTGWWFGTFFIFPYIGNNHLN